LQDRGEVPRLDLRRAADPRATDRRERLVGPRDGGPHATGTSPRGAEGVVGFDLDLHVRQRQLASRFRCQFSEVCDVAATVAVRGDVEHPEDDHVGAEAFARAFDHRLYLLPPRIVHREGRQHPEESARAIAQDERDPTLLLHGLPLHRRTLALMIVRIVSAWHCATG
jgi:hypothetical protein